MSRTTSVTLGQHFDELIAELIRQGRFQTVSEAVRAGLALLERDYEEHQAKLQALRHKVEEGRNSPIVENFDMDHLLDQLHGKRNVG
ncbi:type II toxin-antitoxin system ParD family antitoxin [Endozoicomonas euniceicola]|uniref:Antitoxin ParD n=1 Tax=Endozoicomonas euniceicola TaxID=1234143 RepID=A0ABY6GVK8_9GAMM|nr:type II toxin-antitoxin system ParD family antitoxin [Endozoicomonas euniceicola]UYM16803.1 type II toxin-antitoxin system ParD family antitoxin [Endozoicomonas euniceicola]